MEKPKIQEEKKLFPVSSSQSHGPIPESHPLLSPALQAGVVLTKTGSPSLEVS